MGKRNAGVYSPSVTSTMRSAVTALLGFVALPAIPLSSTLDRLIELVGEIADVTHSSRRQELMDFGEYVSAIVNQLVFALRNEQLLKQASVRRNLEELQRTLDKILRNLYYINSSRGFVFRLRRALFPEKDQLQVVRMRQQLEDALSLFQLAAACNLLARPPNPAQNQAAVNTPTQTQEHITSSLSSLTVDRHAQCQEHSIINTFDLTQDVHQSPVRDLVPQRQQTRNRSGAFIAAAAPNLVENELAIADKEVTSLRRLFHRSRRPLPAMQLAVALNRYSDLLAKSGRAAEALAASQESAKLFKALAEKGPEIYFDSD